MIGFVLLLALIISAFQGPRIQDVDRFLKSQKERHKWVLEFGGITDYAGPTNGTSDNLREFVRGKETSYVFYTPHYMLFATVVSRNGRARCINFDGPRATAAIGEIKEDLQLTFPNLKYRVIDLP